MNWRERLQSRHRPRWWPEDEQWPPERPFGRQIVGRFVMRIGCLMLLVFLLTFVILSIIFWLVAQALGLVEIPTGAYLWVLPLAALTVIVMASGVLSIMGMIRSVLLPMRELLGAAERVADGDFKARAPERGPRELRRGVRVFNAMVARIEADAEQRRDLLADVTHELRTPLTIIQGNLEGLIDGVYPADEEHLRLILAETERLSRLIDDLRTLALAESGALALKKEPTDLTLLARETTASFRAQADAAGVAIGVEEEGEVPRVSVDPARIHEALANLIGNALRYSPRGARITVSIAPEHSADGADRATISVVDAGSGISADELPHIFDRFHRSSDSGGMGLGLTITKNLIAAHGGEIKAISEPGKGTTIRITLPAGD